VEANATTAAKCENGSMPTEVRDMVANERGNSWAAEFGGGITPTEVLCTHRARTGNDTARKEIGPPVILTTRSSRCNGSSTGPTSPRDISPGGPPAAPAPSPASLRPNWMNCNIVLRLVLLPRSIKARQAVTTGTRSKGFQCIPIPLGVWTLAERKVENSRRNFRPHLGNPKFPQYLLKTVVGVGRATGPVSAGRRSLLLHAWTGNNPRVRNGA